MVVVAMGFAACWGILQLAALGYPTRSVRLGTLFLAVGLGFHGCGVLSAAFQYVSTRLWAAAVDQPVSSVVQTAGYTVDPFVEEFVKVLPLLVMAYVMRGRIGRGLTDFVLLAAAFGAGFGLLEAVMRVGPRVSGAIRVPEGWVLPLSLSPPVVPGPAEVMSSWIPAPVGGDYLSPGGGPGTSVHVVWSAVAGLGVGLFLLRRGRVRLAGPALVLLAGAAHAAHNYRSSPHANGFAQMVSDVFEVTETLLWLWPLLTLTIALALDHSVLERARNDLTLNAERTHSSSAAGLLEYARLGLPWTLLLVARFVSVRRSAWYGIGGGRTEASERAVVEVRRIRDQMDAAGTSVAWKTLGRISFGRGDLLRRFWPLLLWLILLTPVALYYVVGATPATAGAQAQLEDHRSLFWVFLAGPGMIGIGLLVWALVVAVRRMPRALREPGPEVVTGLLLRSGIALGAMTVGSVSLIGRLRGREPHDQILANGHVLEALDSLLLAAGLALLLGAFLFFPPSIGLTAVVTSTGAAVLVPSATLSGAFAATAGLGLTGILLSQAASGSSAGSGGHVPDIPQKPPRPVPRVQHWRLRNIVDGLWKGTNNPERIGDGTTMDAIRNELRTGRPTEGLFHSVKGREAISSLNNWLRRFGADASRPDRLSAYRLKMELERALEGL